MLFGFFFVCFVDFVDIVWFLIYCCEQVALEAKSAVFQL